MAVTVIRAHLNSGAPVTADRFDDAAALDVSAAGVLNVYDIKGNNGSIVATYAAGMWRSAHVDDSLKYLTGSVAIIGEQ